MGCDIHLRVEKREGNGWVPAETMIPNKYYEPGGDEPETIPKRFYDSRNYDLFAILADVRNGRGFGGCDTGDGFTPIAPCRSLPDDVSESVKAEAHGWGVDGHSHSWLLLSEILAFDWTQTTKQRGWVNGIEAEQWFRMREWDIRPESYCDGVSGGGVKHISIEEMESHITEIKAKYFTPQTRDWEGFEKEVASELGHTYAQAEWEIDYARCCQKFWWSTIPKLLRVGRPENVRLVFWFDN